MFDVKKFLSDTFGSADGLVSLFQAYRMDIPSKDTVRKWFSRGSIPADWFPVLLAILELEKGRPVRLAKFLDGGADARCGDKGIRAS